MAVIFNERTAEATITTPPRDPVEAKRRVGYFVEKNGDGFIIRKRHFPLLVEFQHGEIIGYYQTEPEAEFVARQLARESAETERKMEAKRELERQRQRQPGHKVTRKQMSGMENYFKERP